MLSPTRRKPARMLALGLCVAALLSACDPVEQKTGVSKPAQTGGVAGATLGAVVAAMVLANPPMIVASVVIGGVAGGALGDFINSQDAKQGDQDKWGARDSSTANRPG